MPGFYVHPKADVDEDVDIGRGTKIWRNCHVMGGARIGAGCVLGHNVTIGPGVHIGEGCRLQNNVSVFAGVTLEAFVFCGPGVTFTNVRNPRAFLDRSEEFEPTLIRTGSTIGAGTVILCGVTAGRYSLIGAGSFLNSDCPGFTFMAGSPARALGHVCLCGHLLKDQRLHCQECGRAYRLENAEVVPEFDLPINPGILRSSAGEASL